MVYHKIKIIFFFRTELIAWVESNETDYQHAEATCITYPVAVIDDANLDQQLATFCGRIEQRQGYFIDRIY